MRLISLIYISVARLTILLFTVSLVNGCAYIDERIFGFKNPDSQNSPSPTATDSPSPTATDSLSTTATDSPSPTATDSPPSSSEKRASENSENLDRLVRSKECLPPNEAEYISGNFRLGWATAGIRHEGLLSMEGRIGKMRIQFFNEATNSSDTVDQIMVLASCTKGLVLLGINPVVAETNNQHPNYIADNLIFRRETDGSVTIMNLDDQGNTALVEIEEISN